MPGESAEAACLREVLEETGLVVRTIRRAGAVERSGPGGVLYAITDFECAVVAGVLRAGDDATDARWVTSAELAELDTVPGLLDALSEWDLLPR
jgi:ADP-ribose pyrophosphatase YjhB (NUDIX family)